MDKLFLDTTYLLPLLGIGVELRDYREIFPKLHMFYEIYYSPISLIEAKWIIIRYIKKLKDERMKQRLLEEYRVGLDLILKNPDYKSIVFTNGLIEKIADELWRRGIRDYFDRMIYAASAYCRAILLTEDEELKSIHEEIELMIKPKEVIDWNTLISRVKLHLH